MAMTKDTWDEVQETFMIAAAVILWACFEYLCYKNPDYAAAEHTQTTRLFLTNIVNSLFTWKFTKSLPTIRENFDKIVGRDKGE